MIQTFANIAPAFIDEDKPTRVRSEITVSDLPGRVTSLTCFVKFEHTNLSDLRLTLVAPDGRECILSSRRGGSVPGAVQLRFDDTAESPAGSSMVGSVVPDWPLAGFSGVLAEGRWQLVVDDLVRGGGGELKEWSITVETDHGQFHIELEFEGLKQEHKNAFQRAKMVWERVITGDLPAVTIGGRYVDDLLIFAKGVEMDGRGGVLGQAGPNYIRLSNNLPITGVMEFDTHDLEDMHSDGSLVDVIVHEMGHVLGIGTLWSHLVEGLATDDPVFVGANAMREYGQLIGAPPTPVPVENTGGPGTRGGHWRESVFDSELMTGWIDRGKNPLSRITIAALADLGYEVNMRVADEYRLMQLGARRALMGKRRDCCVRPPVTSVVEGT